jgi:hypothetical protein
MSTSEPPLPNLLGFIEDENKEFQVSLARDRADIAVWDQIQEFYEAALREVEVHEDEIAIVQILTFSHYHFLTAMAALMRCHLSEMFGAVRVGIDAALIGAQIIADRGSQIAWLKREKPFDNLARYYGNLIKDKRRLPHALIPELLALHKKLSSVSSHADVGTFVHRTKMTKERDGQRIFIKYFQCSDDRPQRRIHALFLAHAFVMILDVFSDFLVDEQKAVPPRWRLDLRAFGARIEREHKALQPIAGEPR